MIHPQTIHRRQNSSSLNKKEPSERSAHLSYCQKLRISDRGAAVEVLRLRCWGAAVDVIRLRCRSTCDGFAVNS